MNALELQDVIFEELVRIFGPSYVQKNKNETYQNISFKYSENTLRQYDHSGNPVCDERWRVILETEDNTIWFGGSVLNKNTITTLLTLMNYTKEEPKPEYIGHSNNRFPFYEISISNKDELNRALYTIIVPSIYNFISP